MDGKAGTLRNKPSRAWPSNSSRDVSRGNNSPKSPTANSPRSPRPEPSPRTASAPLVPSSRDVAPQITDEDLQNYRGSIVSIQDDPFFRHYQTPQSVTLSKEMRSAAVQRSRHEEEDTDLPSPHSGTRNAVDTSVNLPVRPSPLDVCDIG